MNFNALDEYESDLALVLAPLPPEKRAQVLAEVRAHLEAMIEARRADGQSAESATAEALRAFGASEEIGRGLLDEWARGPRMEARGTPLSKREKWRQIAPKIVWVLVFFPLMQWVLPLMDGWKWKGVAQAALMVGCLGIGMWRSQKLSRWMERSSQRFVAAVNVLHIFVVLVYVNISTPARSASPFDAQKGFEIWMVIYFVLSVIGLVWMMRERKTNPPWRAMKTYQANPIATEERYRFGQTSSLIMSATMGVIFTLWMSWSFYGLAYGIVSCIVLLGLYGLLYRWIR